MPSLADLISEGEFAKGLDTPSGNPFGRWAQGVAQRTMHPLETLASAAQKAMDDPTATALDWSNPIGGSLSSLVGMFAGKGAKTADAVKLSLAQKLKQAGIPDEQIWKETGWTSGFPDGKWRFEIPDNAAKYKGQMPSWQRLGNDLPIQESYSHADLYSAYPDTASIKLAGNPSNGTAKGSFDAEGNRIFVDAQINPRHQKDISSTTLHELQHAIQQREGFARGGSPKQFQSAYEQAQQRLPIVEGYVQQAENAASDEARWAIAKNDGTVKKATEWAKLQGEWTDSMPLHEKVQTYLLDQDNSYKSIYKELSDLKYGSGKLTPHDQYKRLAGEAEARLTQARMNMTPEQRLANYPVSQFDIPVKDQIVRYGDGQAMSVKPDYGIQHRPPMRESGAPLHDLTGGGNVYPDDVYSKNAVQYYGTGDTALDRSTFRIINSYKNNPDAPVTIYRAVTKDVPENAVINAGDWVTINPEYAKMHGESALNGDYRIIKQQVKAGDIFTNGDSIHEFGYDPK